MVVDPIEFDVRFGQLFLDDAILEHTHRLRRVVHQPCKHFGNPIYVTEAPWELGQDGIYLAGVYVDPGDDLYKAWYVSMLPPEYPEIRFAVCQIVSEDGLHWRRPELDVFRGHNGEKTNIVLNFGDVQDAPSPTILHEPANESEPWTMIVNVSPAGTYEAYRVYILRSADGVHWRWERRVPDGIGTGLFDCMTAMKGPDPAFPYLLFGRGTEDMRKWGLVRSVYRVGICSGQTDGPPRRILHPDLEDGPEKQIYYAQAFPYEGMYVGMLQWYWETNDPYADMELMTSRDARNWQRLRPREVFFPRAPGGAAVGAFDSHNVYPAQSPPLHIQRGTKQALWFYYWGGQAMHGNRHITRGRGLGLAQLRVDGFCSLRAERFPGHLVTKPFVWPGGKLQVNVYILGGGGNGSCRAEVLTEDLQPIEGMTLDDADPFVGDGIRADQTWKKAPWAIDRMKGKIIRLKFHLDHADLYSFRAMSDDQHPYMRAL